MRFLISANHRSSPPAKIRSAGSSFYTSSIRQGAGQEGGQIGSPVDYYSLPFSSLPLAPSSSLPPYRCRLNASRTSTPASTSAIHFSSASFNAGSSCSTSSSFDNGMTTLPLSPSSQTIISPGLTSRDGSGVSDDEEEVVVGLLGTESGTSTHHACAANPVPTVDVLRLQTVNGVSVPLLPSPLLLLLAVVAVVLDGRQSSDKATTSLTRPSATIPLVPRTLSRVARMSPHTAQIFPGGCWSRTIVPGAGRSVQCLSCGMLDSWGIGVVDPVVGVVVAGVD